MIRTSNTVRALLVVAGWSGHAVAATVTVAVTSDGGRPVADAVVMLTPNSGGQRDAPAPQRAVMIQEHQQFVPFVLPVAVGTTVEFPNRDPFRHHVYSFSAAKTFELKLYGGGETQSVTFDRPGPVALGCNIHDNMLAYIYVVESPYFTSTNADGRALLTNVRSGDYTVSAWHPSLKGEVADTARPLSVDDRPAPGLSLVLQMRPERRQRPAGAFDQRGY